MIYDMRSILNALCVVCLLATLSGVTAAQSTSPVQPEGPVVTTVGEASVKRTPDRAWVTVAAESRARTPKEAQTANATVMAAVLAKLKSTGLPADALRTLGYDLQPEFDYANNRQTLRGYVARNSVEVRVDDLPKLGEILESVVAAGATNVSGVRFDVKDRDAAEREALNKAVADARARADAAASGAGLKVERVLRIQEQRAAAPEPRMAMMREAVGVTSGAPPVVPGEIEIRAAVTLTASVR